MRYLGDILKDKTISWFDFETENLNLRFNLPWQVAVIKTRNKSVISVSDFYIKWPQGLNVSAGAAIKTRFNPYKIESEGLPPEFVYSKLIADLEDCDFIGGHNILGFDLHVLNGFAINVGDDVKFYADKVIDTACIAKGIQYEMMPHSNEDLINWQYKVLEAERRRGVKYNLEFLGKQFEIEHDYDKLHDAIVDLRLNIKVGDKLSYMLPVSNYESK